MKSVNTIKGTGCAGLAHRARLASLFKGPEGLEISLTHEALPPVLLEVNAHLRSGRSKEAKACLNPAVLAEISGFLADRPLRTDLMYVTAKLLSQTGHVCEAESLWLAILEKETHPMVYADLARLIEQDPVRIREAMDHWRRACEMAPTNADYLRAYAACAQAMGDVKKSVQLLSQVLGLAAQDDAAKCQLLWRMNSLPEYNRSDLFEHAKDWARTYTRGVKPFSSFSNRPCTTRPLRVGIVSGSFVNNSPLTLFEAAWMAMDRARFKLFAYSNVPAQGVRTDRFAGSFDVFRDIYACSDQDSAALIRADGIDILVAFGGNCSGSRLGVFVLKPAPVQVDWGALCSLGLAQIDFRLTDDVLDPPDTQPCHTEELVYLSGGYIGYQPPPESPVVTPLPARSNGYVTFGSFNNHLKIDDCVLDMWVQILQRVPSACLALKFPAADDPGVRDFILRRFAQRGLDTGRVKLCGQTSYDDHLKLLGQVDMLLDCYPFNGFRTILEGLWMGVPTISLSGTTYTARAGLAIMKQLGLDTAFLAQSPQAYIDRACSWATGLDELACMRSRLRELLLSSSICDPGSYARSLEDAFQYMWRQWCEQQHASEEKGG